MKNTFLRSLEKDRRIAITVKGRRTGRRYTRPVWFVLDQHSLWLLPVTGSSTQWYRNMQVNPDITVEAGKLRRRLQARSVSAPRTVRKVIRLFGQKYKPDVIKKLYTGFDVAVEVALPRAASSK